MKQFFPQRKLTSKEFSLIWEAVGELLIARMKISFLPSKKYIPLNSVNPEPFLSIEKVERGKTIAGVINGLSSRTPWQSTCLVKVLATNKMLNRRNISHTLHFGINKLSLPEFEAHAWLSLEQEVIIGDENLHQYKEISQIII